MRNYSKKFLLFAAMAALFAACKSDDDNDDDDHDHNDSEVITKLVLTFEDTEGVSDPFSFEYSDPDGPGGDAPTIDEIELESLMAYNVSIQVFDGDEELTSEIIEEGVDHQFFYELGGNATNIMSIVYNTNSSNYDDNGDVIGLNSIWTALDSSTGDETATIILRHEPNKDAAGASEGVLSDEVGGETDIEVTFNVNIQ